MITVIKIIKMKPRYKCFLVIFLFITYRPIDFVIFFKHGYIFYYLFYFSISVHSTIKSVKYQKVKFDCLVLRKSTHGLHTAEVTKTNSLAVIISRFVRYQTTSSLTLDMIQGPTGILAFSRDDLVPPDLSLSYPATTFNILATRFFFRSGPILSNSL